MNILVTGAAGFIGSHVCEYFINRGNHVIGIDNFDDFYSQKFKELNVSGLRNNPEFKLYPFDIRNKATLEDVFIQHRISAVVHLAAKAGVRPSIESIEEYYDVNVNGTLVLLETMRKVGVNNMIFASSSSVYGNNKKIPFSENDNVDHPISPYASTKKSGELLCYVYHSLYKFNVTCLRFFTVYGPRQRPDLAIHKFTSLIADGKPVPLYGDGSTSRDYTYIDDIVDGINCAYKNLNGYQLFNLGESAVISLSKLVHTIEVCLGKKAVLNHLPLQKGDVISTFADISKARKEIGYDPQYSFEIGIKKFVDWYLRYKDLLKSN